MQRVNHILSHLQLQAQATSASSTKQNKQYQHIIPSPFPSITIPDNIPVHEFIFQDFSKYGNDTALTDALTERTYTYAEVKQESYLLATALSKRGIKKGDVIAIYSNNVIEYPLVMYACSILGCILSTINPSYTAPELIHHINDSGAVLLFTRDYLLPYVQQCQAVCKHLKRVVLIDPLRPVAGSEYYHQLIASTGYKIKVPKVTYNCKQDTVLLPYSSGTTGLPKGVELTHYNLVANVLQRMQDQYDNPVRNECVLAVLPFYHIFGNTVSMNCSLWRGCNVVVLPSFVPDVFCRCIEKYQIHVIQIVPPIANYLAKSADTSKYNFSSLKILHCAAAPLSAIQQAEVQAKFPFLIMKQGYGLTETSPGTHGHETGKVRNGSIGKLMANMEALLVDPDTGKEVAPGINNRGELWLRGPNVMKGYWRNEKATKATVDQDGWLHTGDVAVVDEDGYFYIVDRIKELIKVKGLQVAPAELEGILLSHKEIEDAAVIPIPHPRSGELPRAYVSLKQGSKLTEEDIKAFVAKQVARHKHLDGGVVILRDGDKIPKSPSGKILRRELKLRAQKEVGAN
jgi:acyl-CoA synthetase (AMP-forming)/AMP-acid ligase II